MQSGKYLLVMEREDEWGRERKYRITNIEYRITLPAGRQGITNFRTCRYLPPANMKFVK
jgi:hypothetical protein